MSTQIWFISDTHFGHANILTFEAAREDGTVYRLRSEFSSVEEMDETMVDRWNAVVRPQDHIYHLGDVAVHKRAIDAVLPRLNGHKRLLVGNHDIYETGLYFKYFERIMATRVFDRIVFSHIPIHPNSVGRFSANVHGHLHNNTGCHLGWPYLNISCEHTNYAPISFEDVKARVKTLAEGEAA